ncbi:MAG: VOC family protein [candidate division Zixibacteria bacterium]|nr:VOC family protein [candidate division Zixibacteria bacterium]
MFKVRSLEHVAIAYRDTDAAAQWFCNALGFEVVFKALNPTHGVNFYFVKDPAGTGLIEIIPMPAANATKLGGISTAHVHIAFDVDDIYAAVEALQAKGVTFEGPPAKMGENMLVFFRDPEGAPLQLVQRAKPLK